MEASLLIRLIDQVTGPAAQVRKSLRGIRDLAGEFRRGFSDAIKQGFSVENIEQATQNAERKLAQARERLRGAIGMGLALAAPVVTMAKFEERLVDFGNTAGIFGDDLRKIEAQLRATGPAVNKSATEMLDALEYLVGKGLSPEAGLRAIRAIGMTSTATKADVLDMAASGYAVLDNLKVPAEDLQLAYDAMALAGKRGGFELKGMAQFFPGLTAKAQALGMKGVSAVAELAAALQIARKGAGSDSEAANNMQNFLSKLSSQETVKRFKELGLDVEKEFKVAEEKGVSVFEHMLTRINEVTKGNTFVLNELFGDEQVKNFLLPMMANMEEFRQIRDDAMKAAGVNEADFARVMETATAKAKALMVELDNLMSASSPLLDVFKELAGYLLTAMRAMNAFATENPELTRYLILGAAALMGMSIAARLLAFTFAGLRLGLINVAALFLKFKDGRNIAIGWRMLSGTARALGGSLRILGRGAGLVASSLVRLAGVKPSWELVRWLGRLAGLAGGVGALKTAVGGLPKAAGNARPPSTAPGGATAGRGGGMGVGGWLSLAIGAWGVIDKMAQVDDEIEASKKKIDEKVRQGMSREDAIAQVSAEQSKPDEALTAWFERNVGSPASWLGLDKPRPAGVDAAANRKADEDRAASLDSFIDGPTKVPPSGGFASMLSGMDKLGGVASDMETGGRAVADGGQQAGAALQDGAAAIRAAAAALSSAARANVSGTGVRGGSLGTAIQDAKAGALHGGTD